MSQEMQVTGRMSRTKPRYEPLARQLLAQCQKIYEDPENEKAFQAWKAERASGSEARRA